MNNQDSEFIKALELIESEEPASRIAGLLILEALANEKSARVVESLTKDPSTAVSFQAERIFKRFREMGIAASKSDQPNQSENALLIRSGPDLLKTAVIHIAKNFSKIYLLFLPFAVLKILFLILLTKAFQIFVLNETIQLSFLIFLLTNCLINPLIWHLWGYSFSSSIPNFTCRDKHRRTLDFSYLSTLFCSQLFTIFPLIIAFAPFYFGKPGVITFILLLPLSTKIFFLASPLMPLKIMRLRSWLSPIENCVKLFARSNKLMVDFLRPGFLFFITALSGIFTFLVGLLWVMKISFSPPHLWVGFLISESLIAPIWMGYRIIFSLLFFPEETSN